jgi:hypothetical protein
MAADRSIKRQVRLDSEHFGVTFVYPNSWVENWDFSRDGLHVNRSGAKRLSQLYSRVCGIGVGGQVSKEWRLLCLSNEGKPGRSRETTIQEYPTPAFQTARKEKGRTNQTERKIEEATNDEWAATRGADRIESNSLVILQVNCRSILNNSLDFWNLVDT